MTNVEKMRPEISAAARQYCEIKSRNYLKREANISIALISNILNEKWDNISDSVWIRVWNVVNPEYLTGLIETSDFKACLSLYQKVIKGKLMAGLIGDTGMGKTTVLTTLSMRENVHYFYIDSTVTPKVFLKDLLSKINVNYEGTLNDMLYMAAQELNGLLNPVLLIDESAKLTDKMMLILHSLRDRTRNNCSIILAGMPDFKNKLIKFSNKGTTGYAEFFRRIEIWHEMKGLNVTDLHFILNSNGISDPEIQKSFRSYRKFGDLMNEIRLHKELIRA